MLRFNRLSHYIFSFFLFIAVASVAFSYDYIKDFTKGLNYVSSANAACADGSESGCCECDDDDNAPPPDPSGTHGDDDDDDDAPPPPPANGSCTGLTITAGNPALPGGTITLHLTGNVQNTGTPYSVAQYRFNIGGTWTGFQNGKSANALTYDFNVQVPASADGQTSIQVQGQLVHPQFGARSAQACIKPLNVVPKPVCYQNTCDDSVPYLNCPTLGSVQLECSNGLCVNPYCASNSDCECNYACVDLEASPSAQIKRGDTVQFTCTGSGDIQEKANFRVLHDGQPNGDGQSGVTLVNNSASWNYRIADVIDFGDYKVQCQICNSVNGVCTDWGKGQTKRLPDGTAAEPPPGTGDPNVDVSQLVPLYQLRNWDYLNAGSEASRNVYKTTYGFADESTQGYIFQTQQPDTERLYQLYKNGADHLLAGGDAQRDVYINTYGYHVESHVGWIYKQQKPGTVPLYQLYGCNDSTAMADHLVTTTTLISNYTSNSTHAQCQNNGWESLIGYVYPDIPTQ